MSYTIKEIYIYPIKGFPGIQLEESKVTFEGLLFDRNWMLIDNENNRFISQRSHPLMTQFRININETYLEVSHNDDSINIPLFEYDNENNIDVTVWDDTLLAHEVNEIFSLWFSHKLNGNCKLVRIGADNNRKKILTDAPHSVPVSLADAYPILIAGTASFNELNQRCGIDIPSNRFRANIIVETTIPHEEDTWKALQIEDTSVSLKVIKPCVRCQVIGIDQITGESDKEPTKTLATYRKVNNGIIFGANTIVLSEGIAKVNDKVILE